MAYSRGQLILRDPPNHYLSELAVRLFFDGLSEIEL